MKPNAHGVLFAVPLPDGTFLSGRVMLDINACLKRRLFPTDSPLPFLGKAYLIEMYTAISHKPEHIPSSKLIQGAFVESDALGESWPIIGNTPVEPREVEFPESIIGYMHSNGDGKWQCGEIQVLLPLDDDSAAQIGQMGKRHSAFLWEYTCLRAMGREAEVPKGYEGATLAGADLRDSPYRAIIYEHLPFSMEVPYFEKQKLMGLDIERLYAF